MAARLLFILTLLSIAGCGGGGVNVLPEPFTRERADGKIPVKTELIRQQVRAELAGTPESEAEVARWQQIETDYNNCRWIMSKAKSPTEAVFANCMSKLGYVYMLRIDAEQLHNDIEFEMTKERDERIAAEKKRQEEAERIRRQNALNDALVAAVHNGDSAEEARLIAEGANPNFAENARRAIAARRKAEEERIAAAQKAEEERIAAQKKRQEEATRARRQKELNAALVVALNTKRNDEFTEIERLINDGADINTKSKDGLTPLHYAANYNLDKVAIAFIKAGADINAKTNKGNTPLHLAAHNEAAHLFLGGGIDTIEIINVLIKARADIDAKSNDGWTPLHYAAQYGNTKTGKVLIKAGADIDAKNNEGATPLHIAAGNGQTKIADALIKEGAHIDAKSNKGWTPLHGTAELGKTETAHALIKAGADIDAKSNDGWTPLHWAASRGHTEIADALIKAGANIHARTIDGWTPLHWAASEGKTKIANVLIKEGADTDAKTNGGFTPLDYAIYFHGKNSEIARILREAMAKQGGN